MDPYERAIERLCDQYDAGEITAEEYDAEVREVHAAHRQEAEEAARETMESYGYYDDR